MPPTRLCVRVVKVLLLYPIVVALLLGRVREHLVGKVNVPEYFLGLLLLLLALAAVSVGVPLAWK